MLARHATRFFLVACLATPFVTTSVAQDALPPTDTLGSETANFGLAPFQPIPTLMLSDEHKRTVRALEDRQLQERRALEDRYAVELRALLIRQADEREALTQQLASP